MVAIAAGSLFAASSGAARQTTAPGAAYNIAVLLDDTKIAIVVTGDETAQRKYASANGLTARFPRGALIRFVIRNVGKLTYLPALKQTSTHQFLPSEGNPTGQTLFKGSRVIPPTGRRDFEVNFYYRNTFVLEALLKGKPHGKPIHITIY